MQTIDFREEQRRQNYLEWLYTASGRTNGLYTGLYTEHVQRLIQADMKAVLGEEAA